MARQTVVSLRLSDLKRSAVTPMKKAWRREITQ
jgi:hypothetical protein